MPVSRSWMSTLGTGRVGCTDAVTARSSSRVGFQGQSWSSHRWMMRTVHALETSYLHSNVAGAAQGDRGWGTQGHQAWHIRGIRVAGGAGLGAGIRLRERWRCRSQH